MKNNKFQFILIPALASAILFPIFGNSNSAKANNDANLSEKKSSTDKDKTLQNTEISSTKITNKIPMSLEEYKQKSALELAKLIKERKVTSEQLVDLAYKAIELENPKLNAVITEEGQISESIKNKAYEDAKNIDKKISAQNLSSNPIDWESQPFLGVPTLIKELDNIAGGNASLGVYFDRKKISQKDGFVAQEFRKLGFIILGQTNTPELGTRNITDSKLFGPARNPWDSSRNTGGSSGGSAGAISSGMVPIASASDAGGSVRIPAAWTGLIGLKPTGGVVKFPLVKNIEDAKVFFNKTEKKTNRLLPIPKDLKTLKIGYSLKTPMSDIPLSEDAKKAVLKTVEFLKQQGFNVEEVENWPIDGYDGIKTYTTLAIGGSYTRPAKAATETTKYDLDPATYALGSVKLKDLDTTGVKKVSEYQKIMNEFYKKYDIFLTPTNAVTAPSNDKNIDPYVEPKIAEKLYNINNIADKKEKFDLLVKQWEPMMRRTPFTWIFNLTGDPAISLPVYVNKNNLPLGIMLAAKANSEKILLEFGQLFQDNNQFIMHPSITNTASAKNGNKIGINDYGTNFEYNIPNYAPIINKLPELKLNSNSKSKIIKKDITNNFSQEDFIEKIINNIENKKAISNSKIKLLPKTGINNANKSPLLVVTLIFFAILIKKTKKYKL
ncbi:amidase family protein [Gemella cuniculi]|uniref:amidase family protein n=1 Tax=Gemella cuniculi TaxID=150240 RepID=UPI000404E52A|nr:amidase family protein [Gemella cuniculi]